MSGTKEPATTTVSATTELATTTEVETTTAEPLPYTLRTITVTSDTVYLLGREERVEGAFPLLVPVYDYYNPNPDVNHVLMAFNDKIKLAHWDLEATET